MIRLLITNALITRSALFVLVALVMLFFTTGVIVAQTQRTDLETTDLEKQIQEMQPGWNLGNTFEANGSETSWGNPETTRELIDTVAKKGYKSIRIPITWNHRVSEGPAFTIDPVFMNRIQEIVDWSLDANLTVIINLHHDSDWIRNIQTDHDLILQRYSSLWTQISEHFRDYPNQVLFESVNEPRFSEDWSLDNPKYFEYLDELNQDFVNIVRETGGNNTTRPLVLPTLTCSGTQARIDALVQTIETLADPNIVATIHYYGYYPFSVNISGTTTFDSVVSGDIEDTFERLDTAFTQKHIPVIIGEFGLLGFDKSLDTIEHGEILKYVEYMNYYAQLKGYPLMLWDNGQHLDRLSKEFVDDSLYQMMMNYKERSGYTSSDLLFVDTSCPITDLTMDLITHGLTFETLSYKGVLLRKEVDYTVTDTSILFKKEFLEEQTKAEGFGEQGQFICHFSGGNDWIIHLVQWQKPVLKDISGKIGAFAIPVNFNGDQLATLEIQYADGSNTEPSNWSSYKEYGVVFVPNYRYKMIELKPVLLENLNDGDALVKLHFRSGIVLEYNLNKNGKTLVGTDPLGSNLITNSDTSKTASNTASDSMDTSQSVSKSDAISTDTIANNASDGETSAGDNRQSSLQGIIKIVVPIISLLVVSVIGYRVVRNRKRNNQVK